MKKVLFFCGTILFLTGNPLSAQPFLPDFSIKKTKTGETKLSWRNSYRNTVQLLIQRSTNGGKSFTTIRSATNPEMDENSFTDKNNPNNSTTLYRISYTLRGGKTIFTTAKTVYDKTIETSASIAPPSTDIPKKPLQKVPFLTVHNKGYVVLQVPDVGQNNYRLVIYDAKEEIQFNIQPINSSPLIFERGNFMQAGWYSYALYANNILIEKNKFYLAR